MIAACGNSLTNLYNNARGSKVRYSKVRYSKVRKVRIQI